MATGSSVTMTIKLDKFECPVCYQVPADEVYQCTKGHVLCSDCYANTKGKCPQCRVTFSKIRNRAFESILDALKLDCEHKEHGCEEKLDRKNARVHNESCSFRKSVNLCEKIGLDCAFQIPRWNARAAVEHFKECHQFHECSIGHTISIRFRNFESLAINPVVKSRYFWSPMLIQSVVGGRRPPLYTLILSVVEWKSQNFSIDCISLSDLLETEKSDIRVEFSIKSQAGRDPLTWSVKPFPSMNCMGLVNQQTFRVSVPVLQKEYMDKEKNVVIELKICQWMSTAAAGSSRSSGLSADGISVTAEGARLSDCRLTDVDRRNADFQFQIVNLATGISEWSPTPTIVDDSDSSDDSF